MKLRKTFYHLLWNEIIIPPPFYELTKITQLQQALKGAVKSNEVDIKKWKRTIIMQLNSTYKGIETNSC